MKMGRMHRVPLTARALEILKEVRPFSNDDGYVFPSPLDRCNPLSNMSMATAMRRLEFGDKHATVHGFRQCLSAWARENTEFRIDTIEAALAHRDEDRVARAYNHAAEYWTERRELAAEWGKFCTALSPGRKSPTMLSPLQAKCAGGLRKSRKHPHNRPRKTQRQLVWMLATQMEWANRLNGRRCVTTRSWIDSPLVAH